MNPWPWLFIKTAVGIMDAEFAMILLSFVNIQKQGLSSTPPNTSRAVVMNGEGAFEYNVQLAMTGQRCGSSEEIRNSGKCTEEAAQAGTVQSVADIQAGKSPADVKCSRKVLLHVGCSG